MDSDKISSKEIIINNNSKIILFNADKKSNIDKKQGLIEKVMKIANNFEGKTLILYHARDYIVEESSKRDVEGYENRPIIKSFGSGSNKAEDKNIYDQLVVMKGKYAENFIIEMKTKEDVKTCLINYLINNGVFETLWSEYYQGELAKKLKERKDRHDLKIPVEFIKNSLVECDELSNDLFPEYKEKAKALISSFDIAKDEKNKTLEEIFK
mgnify:FL=1